MSDPAPPPRRDVSAFTRRAAVVVVAVVIVYVLFALWQTNRRNGDALLDALAELGRLRSQNDRLVVVVGEQSAQLDRQTRHIESQSEQIAELRDLLIAEGVDPDRALGAATAAEGGAEVGPGGAGVQGPGDGRPPGAGGGSMTPGPPPTNQPPGGDGGGRGGRDRGGGDPPPPPPREDRPRCRLVDPLTGRCLVRLDTPVDPAVDRLYPLNIPLRESVTR